MVISKYVIPMRVLQKKFKSCQPIAVNSFIKWYHSNVKFSLASNSLRKPFYLTRGFNGFFAAVTDCILVLSSHFCLLVIQEPENWCFLAFSMVNLKMVYVVSSSKISSSKSVKIFHWIFGTILPEGHALSRVHNFYLVCQNTTF